jgi:RNA-binding protein YhbY
LQLLNNNPIYRLLIPKPVRTFFWKIFLSSKIINSYKDSSDKEIKEIILNIKKNGIQIISSTLSQEYDASKIKVYYDEIKNLNYVNFKKNKKIYFKKKWSKKRIQKALNQLYIEQDINSPHRYLTNEFNVDKNTIVADIGCAEANFSLDIIDKVKHIYLFETNNVWDEPLKATFEKYKDKVTIVNKMFSNKDSANTIDGGKFLKDKGVNFLKIDVDGYEEEVMNSLQENLKTTKKIKIALCTYHADTDYKKYKDILENYNFKVSSSKGYMIFYWDKNLKFPYLRRGVLRAEK